MSAWQTVALGAVAGFTIFLGLPLGRLRGGSLGLKTFLSGLSVGFLVFLLFYVLAHAPETRARAVRGGVVRGGGGRPVRLGPPPRRGPGRGPPPPPVFPRVPPPRGGRRA